jgi:hypothetical protein
MTKPASPCSDGLQAAVAPLVRTFTKAGSRPQGRRNAVFRPERWGPENIPAFLPEHWFTRHFTPIDGVSAKFTRRTASLRLVQMVAGGSLGEAARFLGIGSADVTWPGASAYGGAGRVHASARQQPGPLGFDVALEALAGNSTTPQRL